MALLTDAITKTRTLLVEIERTQRSYEIARNLYADAMAPGGNPVDIGGVAMVFLIDGYQIPVPMSDDPKELVGHLAASINHLATQLAELWQALHATSLTAVQYVNQAFEQSQEPGDPEPPAIAPFPQVPQSMPVSAPAPPVMPPQRTGLPAAVTLPQGTRIPTVPVG